MKAAVDAAAPATRTHTHTHTHIHTHTHMACQGFFHCIGSDCIYLDIHKRSATAVVADELCLLLIKTVLKCGRSS